MSTFILVHGAWQSVGTWDRLSRLLQKRGHKVITPILRGLGTDQSHLTADDTSGMLRRSWPPCQVSCK
jgi:hypothetical protein